MLGGILHGAQTRLAHLVDAQLGGAAEAVLLSAQDAVHVVLVAVELQHHVHRVFEHLGPSDAALLGDMADDDDGHALGLAVLEQGGGALTDLRDAAGGALTELGLYGLYGVYDQEVGL